MNLAGVLPWIHWRGLLILGLLAAGNVFCMACPFLLPRTLARRWLPAAAGAGRAGCGANGWRCVLLVAFLVGLRGVRPLGQPVVDRLDRAGLLRRGLRHRRLLPRRVLLQVPLPDRPVQLRAVAGLAAGSQGPRPGRLRVVPDQGLHPRPRRHSRLRAAPVPAAQGGQHGLHVLPRLRPRLPARQRRHARRPARQRTCGTTASAPASAASADAPTWRPSSWSWCSARSPMPRAWSARSWTGKSGWRRSLGIRSPLLVTSRVLPARPGRAAAAGRRRRGRSEPPVGPARRPARLEVATRFSYALVPLGFGMWLAHYSFHFLTSYDTVVPAAQRFAADLGWRRLGEPDWGCACCRPVAEWLPRLEIALPGRGLAPVALHRLPPGAARCKALAPWALLLVLLVRGGRLDRLPADADARHALRDRDDLGSQRTRPSSCWLLRLRPPPRPLHPSRGRTGARCACASRRRLPDHRLHFAHAVPGRAGGRQRARAGRRDRGSVPEAQVTVRLKAPGGGRVLECPATTEAATNKLFHAAVFELPEPGWWDVEVAVEGPHGPALVRFEVEAAEPPPRWLELWPWFTWPALVVALFGLHQVLVRRRVLCQVAKPLDGVPPGPARFPLPSVSSPWRCALLLAGLYLFGRYCGRTGWGGSSGAASCGSSINSTGLCQGPECCAVSVRQSNGTRLSPTTANQTCCGLNSRIHSELLDLGSRSGSVPRKRRSGTSNRNNSAKLVGILYLRAVCA